MAAQLNRCEVNYSLIPEHVDLQSFVSKNNTNIKNPTINTLIYYLFFCILIISLVYIPKSVLVGRKIGNSVLTLNTVLSNCFLETHFTMYESVCLIFEVFK